ncbi:MAG: hypothetical protein AAGE52_28015 [Myxococcota bacterium]
MDRPGAYIEEVDSGVIDVVLETFESLFHARATFDDDRDLAGELRQEIKPAAESLGFAVAMETASDESSLDHHEGMAMVSLLGRRAAILGASPTAAMALVPCLADALREVGPAVPPGYAGQLQVACVEGFVRGREERLRGVIATKAADAIPVLEIGPVLALVLAGDHEAPVIQTRGAAFSRRVFGDEVRGCVIDISRLQSPDRSRGAAVLEITDAVLTVGAACAISGVDEVWRSIFDDLDASEAVWRARFDEALDHVLAASGQVIRPRFDERLRRLWKR